VDFIPNVRMRIHIRRKRPRRQRLRYPLKPTSFLTSLTVHAALVSLLFGVTSGRPPRSINRPLYETEIKPNEKKIVWYNFRETVPNLPATKKIGTAKNPQGKVVSPQIVIATSKEATKSKQFIWQPTPQKKIEEEIKAPNLVAVKPAAAAPPEPNTKEAPKPPVESPKIAAEPIKVEEALAVVKQPPRRFQPTPQQARPQVALQTPPTIVDAPPDASVLGGSLPGAVSTTFNEIKIPPKQYVPPNMSKSNAGTGGDAAKAGTITEPVPELPSVGNVNMAIVGLHPSDLPIAAIPTGTLPGKFSTAPNAGKASTGNLPISASGVPNLVVDGGAKARSGSAEPAAPNVPKKTVLYRQVVTSPIPSTLSAPLRPGNRRIPSALESRFQGRNVYTMVLPAPNLPGYAGDWVLWFADRQVDAEATVQMRAPLPYRKKVAEQEGAQSGNSVMRVQIAGVVGKDGRWNDLTILKGGTPGIVNAVLEDLKTWEFTPATRNMAPVDVEVVIEIPFRQ
jgi:hypothetical protein